MSLSLRMAIAGLLLAASAGAESRVWNRAAPLPATGRIEIVLTRGSITIGGDPEAGEFSVRATGIVDGADGRRSAAILDAMGVAVVEEEGGTRIEAVLPEERPKGDRSFLARLFGRKRDPRTRVDMELIVPSEASVEVRIEAVLPEERPKGDRSFLARLFGRKRDPRTRIDLELIVPSEASIEVRIGRADVTIRRIRGDVIVSGTRGNVDISEIGGRLDVTVSEGDLSIGDVAGEVDVRTGEGEIEARRIGGSLTARGRRSQIFAYDIGGRGDLRTLSGDVLVEECVGDLQVESIGGSVDVIRAGADLFVSAGRGDISVRGEAPPGIRYELVSDRGDVDLVVPGGWDARIEAYTGSGTIQCFLPVVIEEVTRNHLVGISGEGNSAIRLESRTGDLRISRTD